MMMKAKKAMVALTGVLGLVAAQADGAANDRMGNATELRVGTSVSDELVREWDDHRIWFTEKDPTPHVGGWRDMREDNADLSRQMGGYWFYVLLTPGTNVTIALTLPSGVTVNPNAANAKLNPTFSRTVYGEQTKTNYYFIGKEAWQKYHTGVLTNYFRIYSGEEGSVGRALTATYKTQSIKDFVRYPGAFDQPLDLPLEGSGQTTIDEPPECLTGYYYFWPTVYAVNLKAGTTYTFWGDRSSSGDMDVFVNLSDSQSLSLYDAQNFPGLLQQTWNGDSSAILRLRLVPTRDISAKLLVTPDKHHNVGKVTGRTLYWTVGNETPEKTATYVGTLKAQDEWSTSAFFEVDVADQSGWTNLTARVTVNGSVHVLEDAGPGLVSDARGSHLQISSTASGKLHVDGSLVIPGSGEYFFAGDLQDGAFTVAYDPGEGTGTMNDLSCQWGKVYSLDDCDRKFTAPSGKPRFVGWQQVPPSGVGGKFYDAKMLIYNLPHEAGKKVVFRAIWAQ